MKHGFFGTMTYRTWHGIKARCFNENNKRYASYGGRGIGICRRWRESVVDFCNDMGDRPAKHSIERKNNDLGYTCGKCDECLLRNWPANCVWATGMDQARNKRNNRWLEFKGERKTLAEWARALGLSPASLHGRLDNGWSLSRALSTPSRGNGRSGIIGPRGSKSGHAKLTEADIPKIRSMLKDGLAPADIGRLFGVSRQSVNDIRAGRTWSHVPQGPAS